MSLEGRPPLQVKCRFPWKLLVIERIFDCRCAAAPPARAHNALSRVCGMAPQMLQPRRQGRGRHGERVHHEEEMCANVEYLVLGHFKRKGGRHRDTKGTHTMLWCVVVITLRVVSQFLYTTGKSEQKSVSRFLFLDF